MNAIELVQFELRRLHGALDKSLAGLTPEQLHAVPGGHASANTIAWGLWHYVRTEDNVVRYVLQNKRPTVWGEGGYPDRLGLHPAAQGTGMSTAEAQALRIKDVALFQEYMAKVWASTDEFFARTPAAEFDRVVTVRPLGDLPVLRVLAEVGVTHGFTHFGEIELARVLVGARPVTGG